MKKLIFIPALLILAGCNANGPQQSGEVNGIKVVRIDGCQYLECSVIGQSFGTIYTHKGNCDNPIHAK